MFQDSNLNNYVFVSKDNEPLSLARLLGNILFDSDSEHQEPIKRITVETFEISKMVEKYPAGSRSRALCESHPSGSSSHSSKSKSRLRESKEGEATNCGSSENGSSSDDHRVGVDPTAVVGAGHVVSTVVLGKTKMKRHLYMV